jgi:hypothetical protein
MLIRDRLGYVYDVPDSRLYGAGHVGYDGLGNPVGCPLLPLLAPLATSLLPAVGDILGGLFKKKSAPPPPPPPMMMAPPPPPVIMEPLPRRDPEPCPPCPVCPVCGQPEEDHPATAPGGPMPGPMPPGVRLVRIRRRRRVHARPR